MKTYSSYSNYRLEFILSSKFWGVFSNTIPFPDANSVSSLPAHNQKTPSKQCTAGSIVTWQTPFRLCISCSCKQPKRILHKAAICLSFPRLFFPRFYLPSICRGTAALSELLQHSSKQAAVHWDIPDKCTICTSVNCNKYTQQFRSIFLSTGYEACSVQSTSICLGLTLLEGAQRICCTSTYNLCTLCRISHMLPVGTGLTGYTQTIYIQPLTA